MIARCRDATSIASHHTQNNMSLKGISDPSAACGCFAITTDKFWKHDTCLKFGSMNKPISGHWSPTQASCTKHKAAKTKHLTPNRIKGKTQQTTCQTHRIRMAIGQPESINMTGSLRAYSCTPNVKLQTSQHSSWNQLQNYPFTYGILCSHVDQLGIAFISEVTYHWSYTNYDKVAFPEQGVYPMTTGCTQL